MKSLHSRHHRTCVEGRRRCRRRKEIRDACRAQVQSGALPADHLADLQSLLPSLNPQADRDTMDTRGPIFQPFQRPEKPGRVRRRKTRRERNKALLGSRRPLAHHDPPVAIQDPPVDPTASKLVVITQGRLSREHRGLFNHEVKSLDVGRLLSSGTLAPGSPTLSAKPSPSPGRAQKPISQSRDKENQVPGGSGPGPPSSPELPSMGQLLAELQCQLSLPQAFPRRNLVQDARDAIVHTLQACHGCVPDLALVLQGCQPPLPGAKPGGSERRMTPFWINIPDQVPEEERQRKQQGTKEFTFPMPPSSSVPTVHRESLAPSRGPWPPPLPSLSSPSGAALGPPTAFDLLKSIWLVATPPPPQPWGIGTPQPMPQPSSPLLPRTSVLDWSPSPPAPLPSLSWVVARNSPEAWSFPPMRLY
ncbi:proline-rich protein 19 isoform X1 [Callithrix jacchus]